jgi:hypothetical protein
MFRDMSMPSAQVEVFAVQRRRRFSANEIDDFVPAFEHDQMLAARSFGI